MGHHPPVDDWATDFDHTDDAWAANPFPIWDELRQTCPVAHSDRYAGVWLPTRHDDISSIAYDTENFTSRSIIVTEYRPPDFSPQGIAPPISSDPMACWRCSKRRATRSLRKKMLVLERSTSPLSRKGL